MPFRLSIALAVLLSGCAALKSYDREVYGTLDQAAAGNVDAAIRILDANNRTGKDLLYYLKLGMLERFAERYPDSLKSWSTANQRIQTDLGVREAMGNWDNARVAIKQTHELEAIIGEQRAKQIGAVEEQAQKKGARTSFKELNGYPVETIDNPGVNALRNSYQSALSSATACSSGPTRRKSARPPSGVSGAPANSAAAAIR